MPVYKSIEGFHLVDGTVGTDQIADNAITAAKLAVELPSADEMEYLDEVTAGTATASKALVMGTTKNTNTLLFDVQTVAAATVAALAGPISATGGDTVYVTGANDSKQVCLPSAVAGMRFVVINSVANKILLVYPFTDDTINGGTATSGYVSIPQGTTVEFVARSAIDWRATIVPHGITSSAAELNILDGCTATYTNLNTTAVTTAGTAEASKVALLGANKNLDTLVIADSGLKLGSGAGTAVTATAAQLNRTAVTTPGTAEASKAAILGTDKNLDTLRIAKDGLLIDATAVTTTAAELNTLDGVAATLTASELNILDGATLDVNELNLLDTTTAGTAVASKAVACGANLEVAGLKPSHAEVADGTIPAYRLVKGHTDGTLLVGTLGSKRIVGANLENAQKASTDALKLGAGYVTVVAAEPITAGDLIKCGDNGRVLQLADADNLDTVVGTGTAGNFGNQPTNDYIEILSSEAADISIGVTIIGTTTGGNVVVTEAMTTHAANGTTAVKSTKADWGLILAVKIAAAHAGTITVRKFTGPATIITIATGTLQAGVTEITATAQGCHGLIPYAKAAAASTKQVGCKYTTSAGTASTYVSAPLNNTTAVPLAAANSIQEIYLGDVATGTTATFYTNATEDDEQLTVGHAVTTMAEAGTGTAYLRP